MNFHETPVGRKFFNQDVPAVIRALNSIADEVRQLREAMTPVPIKWDSTERVTDEEDLSPEKQDERDRQ